MTTAYSQNVPKVDRKSPETRQDDGFQRGNDFMGLTGPGVHRISPPKQVSNWESKQSSIIVKVRLH